jgi:hypothetical protein
MLSLRNGSSEPVRVAQVIVDDAFADFETPLATLPPGESTQVTIAYPWIAGESYEIGLMLSSGAIVEYELEDASAAQ